MNPIADMTRTLDTLDQEHHHRLASVLLMAGAAPSPNALLGVGWVVWSTMMFAVAMLADGEADQ